MSSRRSSTGTTTKRRTRRRVSNPISPPRPTYSDGNLSDKELFDSQHLSVLDLSNKKFIRQLQQQVRERDLERDELDARRDTELSEGKQELARARSERRLSSLPPCHLQPNPVPIPSSSTSTTPLEATTSASRKEQKVGEPKKANKHAAISPSNFIKRQHRRISNADSDFDGFSDLENSEDARLIDDTVAEDLSLAGAGEERENVVVDEVAAPRRPHARRMFKADPSMPTTEYDFARRLMALEQYAEGKDIETNEKWVDLASTMTESQKMAALYRHYYNNFPGTKDELAAYKKLTKALVKQKKWREEYYSTYTTSMVNVAGATTTFLAPLVGPLPAIFVSATAFVKLGSQVYASGVFNPAIKSRLDARAEAADEAARLEEVVDLEGGDSDSHTFPPYRVGEQGMGRAKLFAGFAPLGATIFGFFVAGRP